MKISNTNNTSLITLYIISFYILLYHFLLPGYRESFFENELRWDILSYYLFLPLTFIYHDLAITDYSIIQRIFEVYNPSGTFYQAFPLDEGYVINYTCGMAYLYLPFFLIGHLWAYVGNYPMDGFSFPYQFCVSNGVYIYIIWGLFILRKVLKLYFTELTVSAVLVFLLLGTNYFNEAAVGHLGPHAILFAILSGAIWNTIQWHRNPTLKNSIFAGLLYGLAVLVRPSELLFLVFPILYLIKDKESYLAKLKLVSRNIKYIIVAILAAFVVFIPQLIYWKIVTGNFLFYSYQNTEGFNFFEPHLIETFFSFKNSWLIYTPLIIFPLIGFIPMYKRNKDMFYSIFIFLIINVYILSCWLAWWNGGGFGMRYFVESYSLLAFPFAYFIDDLFHRKKLLKYSIFFFMVLLLLLNQFRTWQFSNYVFPHDRRNYEFFKSAFFATKLTPELEKKLDVERNFGERDSIKNLNDYTIKTIGYYNYENVNSTPIDTTVIDTSYSKSPPYSLRLDPNNIYSPGIRVPFSYITSKDHAFIRVSLDYYSPSSINENPATVVITMNYNGRDFYYAGFDLDKYPSVQNEWNHVQFDYLTPYPFSVDKEFLQSYIWHRGGKPIYIDNFHIQALERKW